MKKIAVIGAGIAGLACAYELQKAGFQVDVFEKEATVGGRMTTIEKDGFKVDLALNHYLNTYKQMKKYAQEFNLKWEPFRFVKYKVLFNGEMRAPYSIISFMTKMKLLWFKFTNTVTVDYFETSKLVPHDTGNSYNLAKKKFSKRFADYLVDGYTAAYNFYGAKDVSSGLLLSQVRSQDKELKDWWLQRVQGGMISIPNALASKLNVKTSTPAKSVETKKDHVLVNGNKYDEVVLACTANITKKILKNPSKAQKSILDNARYASTISVIYKVPEDVFGPIKGDTSQTVSSVWLPKIESKIACSIVNEAYKGEDVIKDGKTLIIVYLHEDASEKLLKKSDKEILSVVKDELAKHVHWLSDKSIMQDFYVKRWEAAMPKLYHTFITKMHSFLQDHQGENNVYLCGDYTNSAWSEGALRGGQRVAQQIIKKHTKE